jgi:hypothetical protein
MREVKRVQVIVLDMTHAQVRKIAAMEFATEMKPLQRARETAPFPLRVETTLWRVEKRATMETRSAKTGAPTRVV